MEYDEWLDRPRRGWRLLQFYSAAAAAVLHDLVVKYLHVVRGVVDLVPFFINMKLFSFLLQVKLTDNDFDI